MLDTSIYLLISIAAIFYATASLGTSAAARAMLIPAGTTLLIISSMLFATGTINVTTGDFSETIENKSTKTTTVNRTIETRNIDNKYPFDVSNLLATLFLAVGTASMIAGANITAGSENLRNPGR